MRQPSLFDVLRIHDPKTDRPPGDRLELYEYFAGAGGFATGAAQAGCSVVYACDSCPRALETHRLNHPTTQHQCVELPAPEAVAKLPTDGRRFHVHCSPPCVKLSCINHANVAMSNRGARGLDRAVDMIEWSLEMMLASACTSWSLEQVAEPASLEVVERVRQRHPRRVAYAAIDMSLLGVPQKRKRLIAAPPALLARLLRKCSKARVRTVRDVIAAPRGTHVRSGRSEKGRVKRASRREGERQNDYTPAGWGDYCWSIDRPAPTVRARHAHSWVTVRDNTAVDHTVLSPIELAALQTFPKGYKLPARKFDAYMQVGNAVPPLVAKLLLEEEAGGRGARPSTPSLRRATPVPRWAWPQER
ncbi:MAG: DNA cytosine methyltransferase [Actinomycetales bacterium]